MDKEPSNGEPIIINSIAPSEKKSIGPTVGLIIVLLLIILGGVYFWMEKKGGYDYDSYGTDAQTEALKVQGTSDEVNSINADIEASNYDNLDGEYNEINAELSAQY